MTASVVIPAHNAEKWIEHAVKSAFDQGQRPIEVIVACDGCTDSTAQIASASGARVLDFPKSNANVARNAGVAASTGEIVFFLDADDWFLQEKIERHLECHRSGQWSFVIDPATMVDEEGKVLRLAGPPLNGQIDFRAFLLRRYWYGGSSFSVRRSKLERIGGWREDLRSQQDIDLWLRLANRHGPAFVLGTSHTMYRQTSNSTSRKPELVLTNLDSLCEGLGFLSGGQRRTLRSHVIFTAADNLPLRQALPLLARSWDRAYDPRFFKAIARSLSKSRRLPKSNLLTPT